VAQPFLIDRAVLDGLAPSIGRSLGRLLPLAGATRIEIGEAFELWGVGVVDARRPLADVAVPTGRFHLQVYIGIDGNAPQPAAAVTVVDVERSGSAVDVEGKSEGAGWRVVEVADASLAQAVDAAIMEVDKSGRIPADVTARLLIAWPYRIHALWFPAPGQDWVYVISALDGLERIGPRQWMDSTEFVSHLSGETYVRGMVDDRDTSRGA
jgi:hypothetical protein